MAPLQELFWELSDIRSDMLQLEAGYRASTAEERIEVAITHARPAGEKLTGGKGINLPDSQLRLPALTAKDVDDLAFIARHADIVGYSLRLLAATHSEGNDVQGGGCSLEAPPCSVFSLTRSA